MNCLTLATANLMNSASYAVLLACGTVILLSLVSLVIALVMFLVFPKDKVVSQGTLYGFRIKAFGASGFFLLVYLLGFLVFDHLGIVELIRNVNAPGGSVWRVVREIRLLDKDGNNLPVWQLPVGMQCNLSPEIVRPGGMWVTVTVTSDSQDLPADAVITLSVPGFAGPSINLRTLDSVADVDDKKRSIVFRTPLELKRQKDEYKQNTYLNASHSDSSDPASVSPMP